ncbi:MAG: DeoR family transcriptional regulator [Spirochaetes bacterium]|nr:DeoR family transcriptional regulator [Spirochaetota bacterium]
MIEHIKGKKVCSIEELQEKFNVSVSTIHRDLNLLEREGRISKT